jgi:hypothetical protein
MTSIAKDPRLSEVALRRIVVQRVINTLFTFLVLLLFWGEVVHPEILHPYLLLDMLWPFIGPVIFVAVFSNADRWFSCVCPKCGKCLEKGKMIGDPPLHECAHCHLPISRKGDPL